MRIVVLGARGQLGAAIVHSFAARHDVTAFDHAALDITDASRVSATIARLRPDAVINCVAFNAVDLAEDQPVRAFQINALAVRTLARAAKACGAILVHYGSDFVFDGEHSRPYTETDAPNPKSVYAASKLAGEWFARDAPLAYVLRVESLFGRAPDGPPARGSAAVILDGLRRGTAPSVFADRTVTPTYVIEAADATLQLLERRPPVGLYHCVSSTACTWVEFAREAAALLDVEPKFTAIKMADLKLRATRPRYCALSTEKLLAAGIAMTTWQEALRRYTQQLLMDERTGQPVE